MTLLLQQNLGTAWGATGAGGAGTNYLLPLLGVGQWLFLCAWLKQALSGSAIVLVCAATLCQKWL